MQEFLSKNGREVGNMLFTEWNWDTAFKVWKEEGFQEGLQEAQKEGRIELLCELVAKGIMAIEDALSLSGCTQGEFSAWMQKLYPTFKM